MLSINNSPVSNYSQPKSNVNFKSKINMLNSMGEEGRKFITTVDNSSPIYDKLIVKRYFQAAKNLIEDGKNRLIEMFEVGTPSPYTTKYKVVVDGNEIKTVTKQGHRETGLAFVEEIAVLGKKDRDGVLELDKLTQNV